MFNYDDTDDTRSESTAGGWKSGGEKAGKEKHAHHIIGCW